MRAWGKGLTLAGFLLMGFHLWWILERTSTEQHLGPVQKIMYWHVPPAVLSYMLFTLAALGALAYLVRGRRMDIALMRVGVETGMVALTVVLLTGPVWAHSSWNTWWIWEPRLTMALITWLTYAAVWISVGSAQPSRRANTVAAILGLAAYVNIPLVRYAIKLFGEGLHPAKVAMEADMIRTKLMGYGVFLVLLTGMFLWRLSQEPAEEAA